MTKKSSVRPAAALCLPLLLSSLLIACSSTPDKPKAPVERPVIQRPSKASLTVLDTDAGAKVVLDRTQDLIVRLPLEANSGLDWSAVDLKPDVLTLVSATFERVQKNSSVESPGTTIMHLKPVAAGSVALNFALRRPHSLQPAVQTVTYDVTVK
jgi:predicted secreted protein